MGPTLVRFSQDEVFDLWGFLSWLGDTLARLFVCKQSSSSPNPLTPTTWSINAGPNLGCL